MKFSLIIPVYNSEKYLEKLLDSIFKQDYNNYEVIIVNDGSKDNSESIIKKFKADNRLKYIYINNSGPGVARKIGFNNSSGDLLFFIDSDDYLPSNSVLKNIANIYEKNEFDVLFFNYIAITNNKEKITNSFSNNNLKEGLYNSNFVKKYRMGGALWQKVFVKNKMNSSFFSTYNNFEDYYTTYKYLNGCDKIYYTKKICYYANRDNSDSLSKKYNEKKFLDTINLLEEIYAFSKYKDVIATIICNYYTFCKHNMKKFNLTKEEIKNINNELQRLKKIINIKSILRVRHNYKCLLKLIYVKMEEVIGRI